MQTPQKPKIAWFVVAATLSAVIAMGFFLDPVVAEGWRALVTAVPELGEWASHELWRPSDESLPIDGTGNEADTNRPWWEGILDGFTPDPPDDPVGTFTPVDPVVTEPSYDYPQTDPPYYSEWDEPDVPTVSMLGYYTTDEMVELYCDSLAEVLKYLADCEEAGEIDPIDAVGLFDLDMNEVPEIITISIRGGYVRYTAYSFEAIPLAAWSWKGYAPGELTVWTTTVNTSLLKSSYPSSLASYLIFFRSIIMHDEDGDHYVSEISRNGLQFKSLFKDVRSGNERFYFVDDEVVDSQSYYDSYDLFKQENTPIPETTMMLWVWTPERPDWLAKSILTSEQRFLSLGK